MDNIRKKIEGDRDLFDDKEPSLGHAGRFEALLKKQVKPEAKRAKRVKLISIFSVAASIAVLIAVAIRVYTPGDIGDSIPVPTEINASDEFRTTNSFYNQQMEEKIADIMCKLAYTDSENQERLTKDIQRIVASNEDFVKEIASNEDQEMAIHYLVKHYKTNINVLENIDEKLGKHTKC
ncbi:hypothetical protein D0T84_11945 [Dysgonomonas sp. 521]|uniref:hypothetical protein n=1 Tax=Dysgonomonas sp. 521 TaxID=2302932 RepID=UPI0013D5F434|nr:hypothetical protein [Dysgonomonas sp. 521]NDV95618.1 hypothetical protein [Dysgonomonas sp. 521]